MEGPVRALDLTPELQVIETLLWDGARPVRAERHIDRAANTCATLGIPFDPDEARKLLCERTPGGTPLRLRLTIDTQAGMNLTAAPLVPTPPFWRLSLAPDRLDPDDFWLRHKTSRRALYDRARACLPDDLDEWLFANTREEICEGSIVNLFFETDAGLATPPVDCGLLPGVLRAELLDSGRCIEAVLPRTRLGQTRLWVGNSLRGLIPARLVERPG